MRRAVCMLFLAVLCCAASAQRGDASSPGSRSVMDAHNCYPYWEWWSDRIDRALSAACPLTHVMESQIRTGLAALDPTSGAAVGERHVVVARGRDYTDVPPLKGIYHGPTGGDMTVTVEVTRLA